LAVTILPGRGADCVWVAGVAGATRGRCGGSRSPAGRGS